MYRSLYGNSRLWSVTPNESSCGKIGHVEAGNKQGFIDFYKFLATVEHEMPRATALIREILVHWLILLWIEQDLPNIHKSRMGDLWIHGMFDPLHRSLLNQIQHKKRQLKKNGTYVVEQHVYAQDIVIVYKEQQLLKQAQYPFGPLIAEAHASFLQAVQIYLQLTPLKSPKKSD